MVTPLSSAVSRSTTILRMAGIIHSKSFMLFCRICTIFHIYRPHSERKGKVLFSQVSVCPQGRYPSAWSHVPSQGVYPILSLWGVPPSRLNRGGGPPSRLNRGTHVRTEWEYPPVGLDGGAPQLGLNSSTHSSQDWMGIPSTGTGWGCPPSWDEIGVPTPLSTV